MNEGNWIDVTMPLEDGMVFWPGDIPVIISKQATIPNDQVNVTAIHLSAHTSTHVDAPLHFIDNGNDVTQLPLNALIGKAKVIYIENLEAITMDAINDVGIQKGDRILFKTRHSVTNWTKEPFHNDYVYLNEAAALFLVNMEILTVGIDYLSIAEFGNGAVVHRILLEKNIVIIEGLNLASIEPGDYEMICLPLNIKGGDGAPARVVLKKI